MVKIEKILFGNIAEDAGHTDAKFRLRLLKEVLYYKINYLYFSLAIPIIQDF